MQLRLIKNTDMDATLSYRVARVVYEQTGAETLRVVEALTSMIKNISDKIELYTKEINIISTKRLKSLINETGADEFWKKFKGKSGRKNDKLLNFGI